MRKNMIRGITGGCGMAILVALGAFGMVSEEAGDGSGTKQSVSASAAMQTDMFVTSGVESAWLTYKMPKPATDEAVVPETVPSAPASEAAVESQIPVSEPAAEPQEVWPAPEPNEQVIVAAQQPEETPQPTEVPVEVPVVTSVEEPANVQIDTIEIAPVEETQAPAQPQVTASVGTYTADAQMASIQGGCTIMGTTYTYLDQMIRYYCANQEYPAFYQGTDAPTIQTFCQIYVEEAQAEGVRAEVAFCQAMKETGFLRFQGDVRIEQFNFAGIGATGGGVQGNYFGSVRDGIRAQIQHLKAYASTDSLNGSCVDPRFHYVKRGTTPYVEWLGIHENPYGGGWAAAVNYGSSIINDYIVKLFSY